MSLRERIDVAIAEFHALHPDWDVTIVARTVSASNRGRGPGASIYLMTADGVGFEVVLQDGDSVADLFGEQVH